MQDVLALLLGGTMMLVAGIAAARQWRDPERRDRAWRSVGWRPDQEAHSDGTDAEGRPPM